MIRIGIDARLTYYSQAGIAQYTQHLIRELGKLDASNRYLLLQSRKDTRNLAAAPNQQRVACWTPSHHRLERLSLLVETLPLRLDLLHSPDFIPPHKGPYRSVITVHDLAFLRYPGFMTPDSQRYYNGQIEAATRRAEHIIAVSRATQADLVNLLAVPAEKISVIYEAAHDTYRPLPDSVVGDHLTRFNLTPGYVLFLGTFEPRKNLDGLLRAYAVLLNEVPDAPPLVMAGRRGWLDDPLFALAGELGLERHVRWLEGLEQEDLPPLYAGAAVLCMPSHYEGFGLPALEAMACGTPVVVANRASLPEVVGDAGLLVDPDSPDDIAAGLRRVLTDSALAADLRQRGLSRAARFSWQETARQTLALYQQVLA
jgi:glycosyltransferase involved in cell wall biosynthesis